MTGVRIARESPLPGPIPRFEIPGWSDRFGVAAGITGRGPDEGRGFDLGLWTQAPVAEVMGRWQALRSAFRGFSGVVLGNQVHGASVRWHQRMSGWLLLDGVDGHATGSTGLLLAVTIADCIPVFLVAPRQGAIALLHAGWRGTAAGILRQGIENLVQGAGASASDIIMHCGVGICGDCYEVGSEVLTGCGLTPSGAGPWRVDLRSVLAEQAGKLGVGDISTSPWCSAHDRATFYSHRGSGGRDGRMVAYLGIPDPAAGVGLPLIDSPPAAG